MVKTIKRETFACGICGEEFDSEEGAFGCEKHPITHDKGVKIGDSVKILNGDGAGEIYTVDSTYIITQSWGHYAWKQYWHTVGVIATKDGWSRQLTYTDYEKV